MKLATEAAGKPSTVLFRGQPAGWNLRSTLMRALPPDVTALVALQAESDALNHFKSQAHLHYPPSSFASAQSAPRRLDWWALMQHHAAPTRLIDWTASPYVAAYFASEQLPQDDGVILVIDADEALTAFKTRFPNTYDNESLYYQPQDPPALRVFTPFYKTDRLVAQQGYFTVATGILDTQDQLLKATNSALRRWVVPASIKFEMLRQLRVMNVAAHSLFPGLDGLGRSAAELVRTVQHAPWPRSLGTGGD